MIRKIAKYTAVTVVTLLVIGAIGVWASLEYYVWRDISVAQKAHPCPGDDVAALIAVVRDTAIPLKQRDSSVWTLGRLCDPRALEVLKAIDTVTPCDHKTRLCGYEALKAIARCTRKPTS